MLKSHNVNLNNQINFINFEFLILTLFVKSILMKMKLLCVLVILSLKLTTKTIKRNLQL